MHKFGSTKTLLPFILMLMVDGCGSAVVAAMVARHRLPIQACRAGDNGCRPAFRPRSTVTMGFNCGRVLTPLAASPSWTPASAPSEWPSIRTAIYRCRTLVALRCSDTPKTRSL
jgi:hypothetical protein